MKVINLFGAPGSGKSTTMAGLVYKLNMELDGKIIEFTPEYFKELVWSETKKSNQQQKLENADNYNERFGRQLEVLAEQNLRLSRLEGKVDYVITDCPLPLISLYQPEGFKKVVGDTFEELTKKIYHNYDNINYLLIRDHAFQKEGRIHDDAKAREIEQNLPEYLTKFGADFMEIKTSDNVVNMILHDIQSRFENKNKLKI